MIIIFVVLIGTTANVFWVLAPAKHFSATCILYIIQTPQLQFFYFLTPLSERVQIELISATLPFAAKAAP